MTERYRGAEGIQVVVNKKIEGIPRIGQFKLGCGYSDVSMALQRAGYPADSVKPEEVFQKIHSKKFNPYLENNINQDVRTPRADIYRFKNVVKEITKNPTEEQIKLDPRVITLDAFRKLVPDDPGKLAHATLRRFIDADIPCMVRFPVHYVLVMGRKEVHQGKKITHEYYYHDSLEPTKVKSKPAFGLDIDLSFDYQWGGFDPGDSEGNYKFTGVDGRYLMMAFTPAKV